MDFDTSCVRVLCLVVYLVDGFGALKKYSFETRSLKNVVKKLLLNIGEEAEDFISGLYNIMFCAHKSGLKV